MSADKIVTACVIVIGNEILSGRTKDANLSYIAGCLDSLGIRLREARVIPDIESVIVAAVNECRATYDYVFTTGGIGPTHDDITAASIAKAFGVALIRHPDAVAILRRRYEDRELNAARLKMSETPEGASLIENPVSGAPGFSVGNVHVMAGVPSIMRAMFDTLAPRLSGGAPMLSRSIGAHVLEGQVAAGLGAVQGRYPDIDIGSYPFYRAPNFGTSLVLRGTDALRLDLAADEVRALIRSVGGEPIEEDATG